MENKNNHSVKVLDLSRYDLEEHVDQSFRTAMVLAEIQPINARHLVLAALIVSSSSKSQAFSVLSSMLSSLSFDKSLPNLDKNIALEAMTFDSNLVDGWSVAEPFLLDTERIWGRDYITWVLLTYNDPSLQEIAQESGLTLEIIQDKWYKFVTSDSTHRDADSWTNWWRAAGVPIPSERIQNLDSRVEKKQKTSIKSKSNGIKPKTYLLAWDPKRAPFARHLSETVQQIKTQGVSKVFWSTSKRAQHSIGDRVFIMRLKERPGIVGSGYIIGSVVKKEHWERKESKKGRKANYVEVSLDTLQEFPLIPIEDLIEKTGDNKVWANLGSGFHIKPEISEILESDWKKARARKEQEILPVPPPLAWVDTDAIPVIGDLQEYQPSTLDSLKVDEQAKIFATLLVAEKVRPPLALGLLGDWGVGKTFFMRLMQESVQSIAGKNAAAEHNNGSVSRAAQIEFNAWHYVDSDLWASLASHIFDGLSEELRGPEDSVDKVRRELRRTIKSSKREQEEANAAIDSAQTERQKAAIELEAKQEERKQIAANYDSLRLKRIWQAVLKVKPNPNEKDQRDWPDVQKLKNKAEEIARQLGIAETIDSVEDVQQVYKSFRELSNRGTSLMKTFAAAFTGDRVWISAIAVAGLLVFIIAWPWLIEQIETVLNISGGTLSELLAPLVQLGSVVGFIVTWASKSLKSISSAMSYLERIRVELNEPRIELAKPSDDEKKIKAEIEDLEANIATEQRRIEEADRQISEAQAEIQRINAGGLVYDFLEGRVRDSRYLDRLGLISVIRQDFEDLGVVLRDWRKHGVAKENKEPKLIDETTKDHIEEPSNVSWDKRPIQRIILYIDDLDRCPPKRVVEVLQAVHLILAFDLFVVVVAVDARWLERSLNEAYNPITAALDDSKPEEMMHRFNAHNYLEKIFQIPFSLPRMGKEGYQKLVVDMIAVPKRQAERDEADRLSKEKERTGGSDITGVIDKGKIDKPPEDEVTDQNRQEAKEQNKLAEETRRRQEENKKQKEIERKKREQEEAGKRIEAMLLDKNEEQFIAALYHFIETPRLAKRLVNIYRLIRVRASAPENNFKTFIDRDRGDYRAVLVLLAISIGHADVAPEILFDLRNAKGRSFRNWLENNSEKYEESRSILSSERSARNSKNKTAVPPSDREIRLEQLRDVSLEINQSIDNVIEDLIKLNGPRFDTRLKPYREWAREVGRFSFRWHLREEF
jgi:hypothetical protein